MSGFVKKIYHFLIAYFSYWYYGRPSRKLIVVGVTGTKGKSTTCRFIASVLEAGGHKVGLFSTVEFQIGEKRWANNKKMTMLGRGYIQKMLKDMVIAGCRYAVVETSSEGILQFRHVGLNYDVVVFTNLGTEHSEPHGGFENLKRDKGKIFAGLSREKNKIIKKQKIPKIIIANLDDVSVDYYLDFKANKKYGFTLKDTKILNFFHIKVLNAQILKSNDGGVEFTADDCKYFTYLVGSFNAYNAMAAVAVGRSQDIADEQIAQGLKSVDLVEGRIEFIDEGQSFKVVVDYAHEPISLNELFKTMREVFVDGQVGESKRLIGVIGSDGGGRDQGKREKMGEISGQLCDIVVIADVNCFDEDPAQIAEMLAVGARKAGKQDGIDLFIEVDRRKGIEKAILLAHAGDIVAITAKGTEPCIVQAGGKKIPWDDRMVAREVLRH
jgi:UDP-N-acetylmuramoyl-L-alanyl-D-glutamate--2,6-diaminopimelate ligase